MKTQHADLEARIRPSPGLGSWLPALGGRSTGLAAHVFTAIGAGLGFGAIAAAANMRFGSCFAFLGVALVIDGLDGALARRLRVDERVPQINGVVLDLVVDFVTYVIAPLFAVWRSLNPPQALAVLICSMLAAIGSALYFADERMKTTDNWFRGFPACWNLLALYYFVFTPPVWAVCAGLLVATALLFAPVASVHPMRVEKLRPLTILVSLAWLVSAAVMIFRSFRPFAPAQWDFGLTPLYFVVLSAMRGRPEECPAGSSES